MRNMLILQEVLEMSATTVQAERNGTLHVCKRDLQDVPTDRSNFTSYVCFQFLYSAWLANVVKKLETTGNVLDIHAGGKPPMSDETVADVNQRLEQSPKKSLRRLSQETGLSY
jgi:hypothetical protein